MATTKQANININTTSSGSGVQKATANVVALQDAAVAAGVALAMTGSKATAAFEAIKAAILTKALGPLAQIAGMSMGVLSAIKKLSSEFGTMGAKAAGSIETLQQQFRPLLKSIEAAKTRMAELRKFAKETPFGLGQVAEANKILETFSKGALSTAQGMTLVGDAAAVAGQDLANVAVWVGRLYDGLQSGRPIGEAAFRLQEMGIFTGQARNAIEAMQESGASFSQMWRVVEVELGRASGGMEYTSKTLESLQQQLEDTKDAMAQGFGEGFLKGEKLGVEAQMKALEALQPAMEEWGGYLGKLREIINGARKSIAEMASGSDFLKKTIAIAGNAIAIFNGVVSAVAVGGLAKFVSGLLTTGKAMKTAGTLADSAKLAFSSLKDSAGSLVALDGAAALANAKMAAMTGGAAAAGGAMKGLGAMGRAAIAGIVNPLTLVIAAISTAAAVVMHLRSEFARAKEANEAFARGTDEMADAMEGERAVIKTVQDLMGTYTKRVMQLRDAYYELAKARESGDQDAQIEANRRVQFIKYEIDQLNKLKRAGLEKSQEQVDFENDQASKRAANKDNEEMARIEADGGPDMERKKQDQLLAIIRDQAKAEAEKIALMEEQRRLADEGAKINSNEAARIDTIKAKIAEYESEIKRLEKESDGETIQMIDGPEVKTGRDTTKERAVVQEFIDKLKAQIKPNGKTALTELNLAKQSGNETLIKQAQVNLIGAFESALAGLSQAQRGERDLGEDAKPADREKKRAELEAAKVDLSAIESVIKQAFGSTEGLSELKQALTQELKQSGDSLAGRADVNRGSNARQELQSRILAESRGNEEEQLAARERIARLTDNQVQSEVDAINLAKERLGMERYYGDISESTYKQRLTALDAEMDRVKELTARRRELIRAEQEIADLGTDARIAREGGDVKSARVLEKQAGEKQADVAAEAERLRVLAETGSDAEADKAAKATKERMLKELEASQKREAEGQQREMNEREASLKAQELERQATIAAAKGQNDRAAALREAAKRTEEEASVGKRVLEAMQRYGVSREEAEKMVRQEIDAAKKQREVEEQARRADQSRNKENILDEESAADAEARGNTRRASRIRRKSRRRNRKRDLMQDGFSEGEAEEISGKEERREKRTEWGERFQAAASALADFVNSLKEAKKKIDEYQDSITVKKLRAEGDEQGADDLEAQIGFEKRVEELQKQLNMSAGDAEKMARYEESLDNQKKSKDSQRAIDELNKKVREMMTTGMAKVQDEIASTQRFESANAWTTDMMRIGGATLGGIGTEVVKRDTEKMNEHLEEIEKVLSQIRDLSSERFVVHSVRPKDDKVQMYAPQADGSVRSYYV